jgi:hypothetical protein
MLAVYVDDFILAAVEDTMGKLLQKTARATLHAIHSVFPPPAVTGMLDAKDPILEKGITCTIQLPPSRAADLIKEAKAVLKKKRVPQKRFQSLSGRLQPKHFSHR